VSGLETLPPDQRAVLQLILAQGRGYADLAATLKLDVFAVRERAHAGAAALASPGAEALAPDARGRVVDYLLGQQDAGERIVTFAELGDSPTACRWAQALREQLALIARRELPELPAPPAAANGSSPHTDAGSALVAAAAAPPAAPPPSAPSQPVPVSAPATPAAPTATAPAMPPAPAAPAAAAPATPPAPAATAPATPPAPQSAPAESAPAAPAGSDDGERAGGERDVAAGGARPSRLGGAILIAGAAALAIVLAIVLIGGGDDTGTSASTSGAQAQTPPTARTQPSARSGASGQGNARIVAQVNLTPPAGGSAIGIGLVEQTTASRRAIAIQAQRLPANGAQDIYAVWVQGPAGAKFLGFVPRQVRANGSFTVTAAMPRNAAGYSTVLVTREGVTAVPTAPGTAILSGPLRLAR
jgi:hypothetical protein